MRIGPFDLPGYAIGECRAMMRQLPADSVHCVVTSPPYWGLRDYGTGDAQIGLEDTPEEFVAVMVEVFEEVRRVLRPDGTLWLNLGDSYSEVGRRDANIGKHRDTPSIVHAAQRGRSVKGLPRKNLVGVPWRVAFALQAAGWWLRTDIVWAKPNPLPESARDRPGRAHEYVFLLSKAPEYFYDREAVKVPSSPNTHPRGRHGINGERHGYPVNPKAATIGDPSRASGAPRPRANASAAAGFGAVPVAHRNLRSVWTIPTQPYSGAHYATFPVRLAETCILAGSPAKTCGACGAPWRRLVDVEYVNPGNRSTNGPRSIGRRDETAGFSERRERRTTTVGWEPTCGHSDDSGRAVVLDPFLGSGTTAEAAEKHGRLWLGFDNDPRCAALIEERTAQRTLPGMAG